MPSSAPKRRTQPPRSEDGGDRNGYVVVFTDGACSGNPGPGGWGWAVDEGPEASGSEATSTNQRMEVYAVYDALATLVPRAALGVLIVSDSTYVVNCFRDRWWQGWEARGWKNSQKQPVANQDLWKPLIELYRLHSTRIAFQWVKGHSGNAMNDRVDRLAVAAAQSQRGRVMTWREHPALVALRSDEPVASSSTADTTPPVASARPQPTQPAELTSSMAEAAPTVKTAKTAKTANADNTPTELRLFD